MSSNFNHMDHLQVETALRRRGIARTSNQDELRKIVTKISNDLGMEEETVLGILRRLGFGIEKSPAPDKTSASENKRKKRDKKYESGKKSEITDIGEEEEQEAMKLFNARIRRIKAAIARMQSIQKEIDLLTEENREAMAALQGA